MSIGIWESTYNLLKETKTQLQNVVYDTPNMNTTLIKPWRTLHMRMFVFVCGLTYVELQGNMYSQLQIFDNNSTFRRMVFFMTDKLKVSWCDSISLTYLD